MKRFLCIALCLVSFNALAQGILDRFNDPERGRVVFLEKGNRGIGIAGSYRSFDAGGDVLGDGFAIMSILNIGTGRLATYTVSPKFHYLVADDLALGFRLDYSGYTLNTDLRADLRNIINVSDLVDDPETQAEINDLLNLRISNRHTVKNTWGASVYLRKYLSFFGSQTFAVFGEARLYANYGFINSCPIDVDGKFVDAKMRQSNVFSTGLKGAVGLCVRLKDNSAFTFSIPILGATYSYTHQHKNKTNNNAHLSQFKIARDMDFLGVQVTYCHFIKSKKHR